MEMQVLTAVGIGGLIAVMLVKWLTTKHIPTLIQAFKDEMAEERKMHLMAIERVAGKIDGIRDEMRRIELEALKRRDR